MRDVRRISSEIEKLINQAKSDEKIQELLRLEGMIEAEIRYMSSLQQADWAYAADGKDEMRSIQLRELLQRIKRHLDDAFFSESPRSQWTDSTE